MNEKEFKLLQEKEDAYLAELLSRRAGRYWLWKLLERAGVFQTSFSPDLAIMARAEGRRELGVQLLTDIMRVDKGKFITMMNEADTEVGNV